MNEYKGKKIALLTPVYFDWDGVSNVIKEHIKGIFKGADIWVYAFDGDIKPDGYNVHYFGDVKNPTLRRIYRLFFPLFSKFHRLFDYRNYEDYLADRDIVISFLYPMDCIAVRWKNKYGRHL